jgi:hypothetical protein
MRTDTDHFGIVLELLRRGADPDVERAWQKDTRSVNHIGQPSGCACMNVVVGGCVCVNVVVGGCACVNVAVGGCVCVSVVVGACACVSAVVSECVCVCVCV